MIPHGVRARRLAWLCAWAILLAVNTAAARSPWTSSRDEDLRISLVTFGPGDAVHEYFGHNALLVADPRRGIELLYNFGMFGFGPDMLPKYLKGQLWFWSAATPVEATYEHYESGNRSIEVRRLALAPTRRRFLADALNRSVQPENRRYLYHHYRNNCSTRVRDLVDQAIAGQLDRQWSVPGEHTYRGDTARYTQHDPIIHFLLWLWMNDSMERPITRYDEAFLPLELQRLVDETTYRDEAGATVRLVESAETVFEADRGPVPAEPSRRWPGLLAVGLALGALGALLAGWYGRGGGRTARFLLGTHSAAVGIVVGIPGLVATLFVFTGWAVTHYNENLLLANAGTTLALPLGLGAAFGSRWALRALGLVWVALGGSTLLLVALGVLPMFDQNVTVPLALCGPLNLGCGLAHLWLRRRARRLARA